MIKYSLVVLLLAGCSAQLPLSSSTIVSCDAGAVCPEGLTCVGTRCVSPELVDGKGAVQVVPDDRATLLAGDVDFGWGVVPAASAYTFTVATDAAFTQVVATQILAGTTATVTLPNGTYYWRVISDVTQPTVWTTRLFAVVSDALYVACGAGDDCAASDSVIELGTLELPFRAVSRAMSAAVRDGVSELRVAKRPSDAAYDDAFTLPSGIRVLGGYSADFATREGRTVLENAGTVVTALNIADATRLDGFVLRSKADRQSTTLRVLSAGAGFVVEDVRFETPLLRTALVILETRTDDIGPTFTHCEFHGSADATVSAAASVALLRAIDGAIFNVDNSTLDAVSANGSPTIVGLQLESASAIVSDSTVTLTAGNDATGILVHGPGSFTYGQRVSLTNVTVTVAVDGGDNATAFASDGDEVIAMTRSTFLASAVPPQTNDNTLATGISIATAKLFSMTSCDVQARVAHNTQALIGDGIEGVLQNNTFVSTSVPWCLRLTGASYPRIVNNVLVSYWSAIGPVIARDGTAQPLGVVNNAVVELTCSDPPCPIKPYDTNDGVADTRHFSVTPMGTQAFEYFAQAGLTAKYRPLVTSTFAGAGIDPTSDVCGPQVPFQPLGEDLAILLRIPLQTCGGSMVDRDNRARPNPPAIGAYEP